MPEYINIIFGTVGFIGSIISILGAVKSTRESRNARNYLDKVNIEKSAIKVFNFKENLNKLYKDISKHSLPKDIVRGSNEEREKIKEWIGIVEKLIFKLPEKYKNLELDLEEIREVFKDHECKKKSLHDTSKDEGTMFQYIEGVIYKLNKKVERE